MFLEGWKKVVCQIHRNMLVYSLYKNEESGTCEVWENAMKTRQQWNPREIINSQAIRSIPFPVGFWQWCIGRVRIAGHHSVNVCGGRWILSCASPCKSDANLVNWSEFSEVHFRRLCSFFSVLQLRWACPFHCVILFYPVSRSTALWVFC